MGAGGAGAEPGGSLIVGPTSFGRMFKRSRWWALSILRGWWEEALLGGPRKAWKRRSGRLYTTAAIIDQWMPRGRRDEALERKLRSLEDDLAEAFSRIADLERRIGKRR